MSAGFVECPANFTYISSVNGCYKVVNRKLNWTDAGRACRSLHKDAHLLVINDAQEQLEVAGLLASNNVSVYSLLLFRIRQRYFLHHFIY